MPPEGTIFISKKVLITVIVLFIISVVLFIISLLPPIRIEVVYRKTQNTIGFNMFIKDPIEPVVNR